jgi:hypothetical protein
MSHSIAAIWRNVILDDYTSYENGMAVKRTVQYEHFVVRGRGIREKTIHDPFHRENAPPLWALAAAYLVMRGIDSADIKLHDGPPPCIFCEKYRDDHVEGFFGEHCRPQCHVPQCSKVTCVQALVGGYLPACLNHFFEGKAMRRPAGVVEKVVEPNPLQWRVEEQIAREIARARRQVA